MLNIIRGLDVILGVGVDVCEIKKLQKVLNKFNDRFEKMFYRD